MIRLYAAKFAWDYASKVFKDKYNLYLKAHGVRK